MRMVRYIILFALCCTSVGLGEAVSSSPCLGIQVFHGGKREEGLSERLMVALAGMPGIRVVERSLLDRLLQEWEQQGQASSVAPGIAVGQIEGVDFFVWIHLAEMGDDGVLEVVSARTGQWLAKARCERGFDALHAMISNLVQHLQEQPVTAGATTPAIAIAFPEDHSGDALPDEGLRRLAADLSAMLLDRGIMVLHRHFTDLLVQERWWEQKGVVAASAQDGLLRGADLILIPSVTQAGGGKHLELALLDVAGGSRLAEAQWPVMITENSIRVPEAVAAWVAQTLEKHLPGLQSPQPSRRHEKLQPETLRVFSRGLLLFAEGRYCEALDWLLEAATHEVRFHEPIHWAQACFAALDFKEVVELLDRFLANARRLPTNSRQHPAHRFKLDLSPGINLVGVTGNDGLSVPESETLLRLLAQAIETRRLGPVFRSSDWRYLIGEYDALIGVEKASGHGWDRVPLLLFENTLAAHVTRQKDDRQIVLTRIRRLQPGNIRRIAITLDPDPRVWPAAIESGLAVLFSSATQPAAPVPSPHCDSRSLVDLLADMERHGRLSDFCSLLRRHPALGMRYGKLPAAAHNRTYRECTRFDAIELGLRAWLIRVLPDEDPIKINRFIVKDELAAGRGTALSHYTDEVEKGTPKSGTLQAHVARFNDPETRIVMSYNALMDGLEPSNYRQTRDALEALFSQESAAAFQSPIRSAHAALSVALGEPYPLSENPYLASLPEVSGSWDTFIAEEGGSIWAYQFADQLAPRRHFWEMDGENHNLRPWVTHRYNREQGEDAGLLFLGIHALKRGHWPRENPLEHAERVLDLLPGSPVALDHLSARMHELALDRFRRSGNADLFGPEWRHRPRQEQADSYLRLCERYAASLVRFLDSPAPNHPAGLGKYWLAILVAERDQPHPENIATHLRFVLDRVGRSAARAVEEQRFTDAQGIEFIRSQAWLDEDRKEPAHAMKSKNELWERAVNEWTGQAGPFASGQGWVYFMNALFPQSSADEWRRACIDFDDRFQDILAARHKGVRHPRDIHMHAAPFLGFHFYRMREDERAERLLTWLCERDANTSSEWILRGHQAAGRTERARQNAWFMRVLLAHRAGDIPCAFRLAQEGIQSFEGVSYLSNAILGYHNSYPRGADFTVLGYLRDFVRQARENPNLPFECPIEACHPSRKPE